MALTSVSTKTRSVVASIFPDPAVTQVGVREDAQPSYLISPGVFILMIGPGVGQWLWLLFQQPQRVQQLIQCCPGLGPAPGRVHCPCVLNGYNLGVDILQQRSREGKLARLLVAESNPHTQADQRGMGLGLFLPTPCDHLGPATQARSIFTIQEHISGLLHENRLSHLTPQCAV
jgi:hypothetical protein